MVKLGGNGPIMANALASFGIKITYLGNLGFPNMHPIFSDFAKRAEVHTIAEPGYTDALEFEDGKIMVGKHQALKDVTWENIKARYGAENLLYLPPHVAAEICRRPADFIRAAKRYCQPELGL